ncbi:hypothetical protein EMPS_00341 [Entomortierella parvispora]|uniref:Uncharacterized protein n=1 Tax=Entomortierella parvispora TaxID=205924 RepID=A0A9P3H0K6_9FUNG|nr:hypothetical protein EMPS_00341 [Entomortierella parvispora]
MSIRKRSLRSAERNILRAIDNLDKGEYGPRFSHIQGECAADHIFHEKSDDRRTIRRETKKRARGKENYDHQQGNSVEGQTSHADIALTDGVQEACDVAEFQEGRESPVRKEMAMHKHMRVDGVGGDGIQDMHDIAEFQGEGVCLG